MRNYFSRFELKTSIRRELKTENIPSCGDNVQYVARCSLAEKRPGRGVAPVPIRRYRNHAPPGAFFCQLPAAIGTTPLPGRFSTSYPQLSRRSSCPRL